jgi:hypothetical protein
LKSSIDCLSSKNACQFFMAFGNFRHLKEKLVKEAKL